MTRRGFRLALFATLLALLVVLLGAWTRLSHAGLGCPDWPGCYGFLAAPSGAWQAAVAERRFPQAPVQADKSRYEMTHRYSAAALVISIGLLAVLAWRRGQALKLPLLLAGLVCVQALFGMWTVTLKLWPPVVTVHLLAGMASLGLLFLLSLTLSGVPAPAVPPAPGLRGLALLALLLVVMQIALGGWVSAHYAAQACPDLPVCQGRWWPPADFAGGFALDPPVGPNYLGGRHEGEARTAIHLAHRLGALLVGSTLLLLAVQLARKRLPGLAALLAGLVLLQLGLGAGNVLWQFPPLLALAHSGGGALLLLGVVLVNYRLWQAAHPAHGCT